MQFPAGAPLDVVELGTNASGATWLSEDAIVVGMRQTGLGHGEGEPLRQLDRPSADRPAAQTAARSRLRVRGDATPEQGLQPATTTAAPVASRKNRL